MLLTRSRSHLQTSNAAPAVPQSLCCNQIVLWRTPSYLYLTSETCYSSGVVVVLVQSQCSAFVLDVYTKRTSKCSLILYGTYDFVACGKLCKHIKYVCSFYEIIEVNSTRLLISLFKALVSMIRSKPSFESLIGFRVTVRLTTLFTRSLWMALVHWFLFS